MKRMVDFSLQGAYPANLRLIVSAFLLACMLGGEDGLPARKAPSDYEAHGRVGDVEIAADFLVHSVPIPQQPLLVEDYLVVEVAWFPREGKPVSVNAGRLTLRVNGRKEALLSQTPGMVAASFKYPDWRQRPTVVGGASSGDAGVLVGRPPQVSRFPGDRRPDASRLPQPPQGAPPDPNLPEKEMFDAAAAIVAISLPEGPTRHPVSGLVYFPFSGRLKSIKRVELLIQTDGEPVALKLR